MAGDWIKMRIDLPDEPEVIAMAESLSLDPFAVCGRLLAVWGWFNRMSRNGHVTTVTRVTLADWLNRRIGTPGFCEALRDVGWLSIDERGVAMPKFEVHNSQAARERELAATRQKRKRERDKRDERHENVTPRGEKRRVSPKSPEFENQNQEIVTPTVDEILSETKARREQGERDRANADTSDRRLSAR